MLEKPLPAALEGGKAGFNLEFLPAAYFHRTYLMDSSSGPARWASGLGGLFPAIRAARRPVAMALRR